MDKPATVWQGPFFNGRKDVPMKPVALVTGAGVRLGRAISLHLAEAGYDLILHYRSSGQEVLETERLCRQAGAACELLQANLSHSEEIKTLEGRWQRLDLLVNNASLFEKGSDFEQWERHLQVNLTAPYLLSQACRKALESARGCIVNIVDIYAQHPLAGHTAYCVSKAGLLALSQNLGLEFAPQVRVNSVAPGAILPPAGADPERIASLEAKIPLGRWGDPRDIAEAVLFLARAGYITGQMLAVDGGRSLQL